MRAIIHMIKQLRFLFHTQSRFEEKRKNCVFADGITRLLIISGFFERCRSTVIEINVKFRLSQKILKSL